MVGGRKIKIGLVGCGTIGTQLAVAINQRFAERAELFALSDIDRSQAERLKEKTVKKAKIISLDELVNSCDLIIEAASAEIAFSLAQKALGQGKDVLLMSVGGIIDRAEELFALAQAKGAHLYLPSGAIAGLDALKAAAMSKIHRVTLITRKPPQGLAGAPYLAEKKIDLTKINQETVVFAGTAREAIRGFPKNVNVCATLSLAGIGAEKTRVQIITSPEYKENIHEIEVEGDFGKFFCRTENVPSPANPKTSFLASLSAVATLKNILEVIKIGT